MKVVGLMSGTSMDGLDAVLLEVEGADPASFRWELVAFRSADYPGARRQRIREAAEGGTPADLCRLHADLGEWLAEATLALLEEAAVAPDEVAAVGSHGQTVWHEPPTRGRRGASLQLGDPATVAERTGIPVVSDFRARDLAAGGHGAPLVPFADRLLFAAPGRRRALQNLGGIGNVTWLPPREDARSPLLAFDTGPGNVLLDLAAEEASAGRLRCDMDGALAARGTADEAAVEALMGMPFFAEAPPRSTGREAFGGAVVAQVAGHLEPGRPDDGWPDVLATLTRFTARSVGDAYRRWVLPRGVDEVILTGGGAHNPALVEALRDELAPVPVRAGGGALGLPGDAREAAAFAVLAWAHLHAVPANVPEATGAAGPRVLGSLTPGRGGRR